MKNKQKIERKISRRKRVRSKVAGTSDRPRVNVFRSNSHLFVQLIDDSKGETLASVSDKEVKSDKKSQNKSEKSFAAGEILAQKALKKKIKKAVFDKGPNRYHGRVKAVAEGLRKGGLQF